VIGVCLVTTVAVGTATAGAKTKPKTRPMPVPSASPSLSPPGPSSSAAADVRWMVCPDGGPVREGRIDTITYVRNTNTSNEVAGGQYSIFDVAGTIAACQPVVPSGPGFAVAWYGGFSARLAGFAPYSTVGLDNAFRIEVSVPVHRRALCLLSDPSTRLDCFGLNWTGNAPTVGDRIPTDSLLVHVTAPPPPHTSEDPGCPTCMYQ